MSLTASLYGEQGGFTPFFRWGNWGSEMLHNLTKVTQVKSGRVGSEFFFSFFFYSMFKICFVKMNSKKETLRIWIIHHGDSEPTKQVNRLLNSEVLMFP